MPSDIPEVNLFIDYAKPGGVDCLLDGITSMPASERPALMSGDASKLRLYFRTVGATVDVNSTEQELPAGCTIVVAGKPLSNLSGTQPLFFYCSSFSSQTGLGGDTCYEADIDLTGTDLLNAIEALPNTTRYIPVLVDIEVRNAGNSARSTYQAVLNIYRQVYQGGEVVPTPSVSFPLESPSGYVFSLAIDDNGQLQVTRVR